LKLQANLIHQDVRSYAATIADDRHAMRAASVWGIPGLDTASLPGCRRSMTSRVQDRASPAFQSSNFSSSDGHATARHHRESTWPGGPGVRDTCVLTVHVIVLFVKVSSTYQILDFSSPANLTAAAARKALASSSLGIRTK
jgi:hypothetical protein